MLSSKLLKGSELIKDSVTTDYITSFDIFAFPGKYFSIFCGKNMTTPPTRDYTMNNIKLNSEQNA